MKFTEFDGGFQVIIGGKTLIEHSAEQPFLFAGMGDAEYKMHHGNFRITDEVCEKLALTDFEAERTPDGVAVRLSRNGLYPVRVTFGTENGRDVLSVKAADGPVNRIWVRLCATEQEHVYGCGEQFSHFDLRGRSYPLWTSEQGIGRNKSTKTTFLADTDDMAGGDYYTTFFPAPTFVSSRKYYCHVDDSCYMDFNFKNGGYHELQIWDHSFRIVFEAAESFVALAGRLTALLGRQPVLPDWVYSGVVLGVQGGTEACLSKLAKAREYGVQVSGIWAQDWEGQRMTSFGKRLLWNWQWDRKLYPGLDGVIEKLRAEGIRFLGYINPYLAEGTSLYKEASRKKFLALNGKGGDYLVDFGEFFCGIVDFTNPDACEWYKRVIRDNLIDFGMSGWMADFGEYLPVDAKLASGKSAELLHNRWPALWAKVNSEAVEESGKTSEVTFFMRAGYTGSQKYAALLWAGDQNVDWSADDGLPSVVTAALSAGMSGCGLHHSDIGGYTTLYGMKRSKELFMRWADMAAFTPFMRTHEGNRPADNWQFDSDGETLRHLARMTRVHRMLTPYLKAIVAENSETGVPVQRPLFMHYEDDEKAYSVQDEYLLGRDLLVAPVCRAGEKQWKAYLPKDNWIHLWTGRKFEGGYAAVEALPGFPPVFYRSCSAYAGLFGEIGDLGKT